MDTKVVIVVHSGYGHTAKVAESVRTGVGTVPAVDAEIVAVDELIAASEGPTWDKLAAADAIVFGTPTYMGNVAAAFKQFMDMSSGVWLAQGWAGKLAAGFTNSGSPSGDKVNTLESLVIFASQHGMTWTPTGVPLDHEHGINRLGGFLGLMTQSDHAPADVTPPEVDHETARRFGAHVARSAKRWKAGAQAVG
ncbi:MAG: flavodoxin family protein [Phycisphaerales bacterium]